MSMIPNVCPRCSNGRPICQDLRPDGTKYTHEETCATYDWSDDLCADCLATIDWDKECADN